MSPRTASFAAAVALAFVVAGGAALGAGESTTLQTWINSINTWMASAKASIASQGASITALTTRVAATETTTAAQGARLTAAEGALATQAGQIATLQTQVAALGVVPLPAPTPIPVPTPTPAAVVLWSAGMETGDLTEWSDKVNSGSADSVAVTAASAGIPPKGGTWVMRQSVTGTGGTRMISYPGMCALSVAGTTFYTSWWDYYPAKITFSIYDMFSFFQFDSRDANGVYSPIWDFDIGPNFTPQLIWSPNNMAPPGPHAGESGKRYYNSTQPIPVGQWVRFEVMVTPSADFTGALKMWMDGQVIFDLVNVKTRFPDVGLGGCMYTEHNAYGSGLAPVPALHYVDNVTVSLGRMPYP